MVEVSIIVTITIVNVVLGVRDERLKKTDVSKKIKTFLSQCQCKGKHLMTTICWSKFASLLNELTSSFVRLFVQMATHLAKSRKNAFFT